MIWCDNVSALAIASNPVFLTRIYKDLKVKYISSQDQIADVLTKGLPYQKQTHGYFGVHLFEGVHQNPSFVLVAHFSGSAWEEGIEWNGKE
uniref:Uncharacterized protein n=1 Tax=Quercus lobata TaxID=97700 RepID=A0A7N2LMH8_QUELO